MRSPGNLSSGDKRVMLVDVPRKRKKGSQKLRRMDIINDDRRCARLGSNWFETLAPHKSVTRCR